MSRSWCLWPSSFFRRSHEDFMKILSHIFENRAFQSFYRQIWRFFKHENLVILHNLFGIVLKNCSRCRSMCSIMTECENIDIVFDDLCFVWTNLQSLFIYFLNPTDEIFGLITPWILVREGDLVFCLQTLLFMALLCSALVFHDEDKNFVERIFSKAQMIQRGLLECGNIMSCDHNFIYFGSDTSNIQDVLSTLNLLFEEELLTVNATLLLVL